mmetsp:Transcript_68648/g.125208  ORF Transcript_68648/g.125208 Transcript_68648/m.125208 type:complete len:381 (+) Transcript_68648:81-1223(+)
MGAACASAHQCVSYDTKDLRGIGDEWDSLKRQVSPGMIDNTLVRLSCDKYRNTCDGRSQGASFKDVAECLSVILGEIGAFLAGSATPSMPQGGSPQDLVRIFCLSARFVRMEAAFAMNGLWEQAYRTRWPAFHQAVSFHSEKQDWHSVYRETQMGRCECTLEVFDREKKPGFAMAAMPAQVQFKAKLNGYIARYISASPVRPELIPLSESHRIRFCPHSARERLLPFGVFLSPGLTSTTSRDARVSESVCAANIQGVFQGERTSTSDYPYRVLEGNEGLKIGKGVELQWKMQEHSPFGWWYGELESLRTEHHHQYGKLAVATITFNHFPKNSLWYRIDVPFGDGQMHPCTFGGTTGGIRAVSAEEDKMWQKFFPKELVVA